MNNQKRNYAMTLIGKPRTHSYGFAQAYLGGRDDVRLHLFTGTICAVACIPEQVPIRHNHRYDFKSKTLKGIIVDKPCLIHPRWECGGVKHAPWEVWEVRPMHEQQARSVGHGDLWKEGSVVPTGEKVYVVEDTPRIIRAGETYEMSADQFHETQHVGNTMTVFKRKTMRDTWSKLIVPPGYTAEHSINQQPNPDWLMLQYWNEVKTLPENALDDIINAAHGEDI